MQLSEWKPLQKHERINAITIDTTAPVDIKLLASQIGKKISV
jgi:hypothetical protein